MNNLKIDKICFDGINLVTSSGILKMCQNPNEFDSFYTHSILNNLAGVMKHSRLFFMNASERVYLLERILEPEGILDNCLQVSRSSVQMTELMPPYPSYLSRKLNRFISPASQFFEKRESFFGLFTITLDQKTKSDSATGRYRLQATDLSYVAGKKVSADFYCKIESAFLERLTEKHGLAPTSVASYTSTNDKKDNLFFLEEDVRTFFKIENIDFQEIDIDLHYQDGKQVNQKKVETKLVDEKAIARDEYYLLTLLSAITHEALHSEQPRFKTINQLYNYPHEKFPDLKGVSESTVRSKVKESEKSINQTTTVISDVAINTRTERTLYKIIAILLESILTSIHCDFKNETEFVNYLFEQDKLPVDTKITQKQALQLLRDIMNDFKGTKQVNNLKELRVQHQGRPYRVFFSFDPKRRGILLCGGDKTGDKRFYKKMIPIAEREFLSFLKSESK